MVFFAVHNYANVSHPTLQVRFPGFFRTENCVPKMCPIFSDTFDAVQIFVHIPTGWPTVESNLPPPPSSKFKLCGARANSSHLQSTMSAGKKKAVKPPN